MENLGTDCNQIKKTKKEENREFPNKYPYDFCFF